MVFSELSRNAQKLAYRMYVQGMDDDLNRDHVVSYEAYGEEASWDGLEFDAKGNVIP